MTESRYVTVTCNGVTYFLSPGCDVTRTVTKDIGQIPRPEQKQKLTNMGRTTGDTIRVDGKASLCEDLVNPNDGYSKISNFNPHTFGNGLVIQDKTVANTLYWCGTTYTGLIRSFTFNERSGEGCVFNFTVIFEVGKISGS